MTGVDAPSGMSVRGARRRWLIVASVLVLVAGCALVVLAGVVDAGGRQRGPGENESVTSLARVTRRSLSETTRFNGTLGYARSYTVLNRALGTVTWLPAVGRVIRQGQVLYRVDEAPVVLLYGSTPVYRPLTGGRAPQM